jgi:hypothetical protein
MSNKRCFACDKKLGKNPALADTRDDQLVFVGTECYKYIKAAGELGYQPPKGGPKLWVCKQDKFGQPVRTKNGEPIKIEWKIKDLDPDYRKDPKTDHFCCRCQKDLPLHKKAGMVHLVNGGNWVLHPSQEKEWNWKGNHHEGDLGGFPIGPECARILGMEWVNK